MVVRGKEHRGKKTGRQRRIKKGWAKTLGKDPRAMAKSDGMGSTPPKAREEGLSSPSSFSTPALLAERFFHTSSPFPLTVDECFHSCYAWVSSKNTQRKSGYMVFRVGPRTETGTLRRSLCAVSCLFARIQPHCVGSEFEISTCIFAFHSSQSQAFEFFSLPTPVLIILQLRVQDFSNRSWVLAGCVFNHGQIS